MSAGAAAGQGPEPDAPLIAFEQVVRLHGTGAAEVAALDRVDLSIEPSEFVAIMGPSGSGKSTCLNIIGCLDLPSQGRYRFNGVDVGSLDGIGRARLRRAHIGFIFQGFRLLKRTSALENVELPLLYRGIDRQARRAAASAALAAVGLEDRQSHLPEELSGGQQQRVAIARAIVAKPSLVIADEPTGALDSAAGEQIVDLLRRLNQTAGTTIVMVTHDPAVAGQARRIIRFRDGRIAPRAAGPDCDDAH